MMFPVHRVEAKEPILTRDLVIHPGWGFVTPILKMDAVSLYLRSYLPIIVSMTVLIVLPAKAMI